MNDREIRKLNMFVRVRDFGLEHSSDFAANSLGKQLFTQIGSIVAEFEAHAASQNTGTGLSKQGTTSRAQARQALRDDLEAITRTSRAMAEEVTGLDDKFHVPPEGNDQLLLTAARAFASEAPAYSAGFIAHELPADFLDDLNADIAAMEAAISGQATGRGHRVAAGAAIDDTIDQGIATVKKLDAIVKNKYADQGSVLAQWTSASHLERDPRRRQAPANPQVPPGHPASSEGSAPPA